MMVCHGLILVVLLISLGSFSYTRALSESNEATEKEATTCKNTKLDFTVDYIGEIPTVTLSNGVEMPTIALGTAIVEFGDSKDPTLPPNFKGFLPERHYIQVQEALEAGIRTFDSGRIYRSHRQIGHVLGEWFRTGQLQHRNEVFLISKVFHGNSEPVCTKSSHYWDLEQLSPDEVSTKVQADIEEALVDLGVGYIDLLLMHWPASTEYYFSDSSDDDNKSPFSNRERRIAAWKVFEDLYERGWLRAIGVSNFSELHIEQLKEDGATIMPMVNQIEASLFTQYPKILEYCKANSIVCQAFSPFRRGSMVEDSSKELLDGLGEKYSKDFGQLALRYLIQKGYAPVFLSTSRKRLVSNHDIFNFEFTDDEMDKLSKLARDDGNWGLPTPYDIE